jgi:allene oxide cyclase-like protein
MTRPGLLTVVVLGLAVAAVSARGEEQSKDIHVTARLVQQTFIGDPASPRLGDRRITAVDLLDESGIRVGTGGGACTVVSVPPLDTLEECLLTAVLAEGQLIFGGLAPFPEVGVSAQFGILGGTDEFRNTRGEATLVVTTTEIIAVTFDLD